MPASFHFPSTLTDINGISIREIAQKFGTPTYIYDAQKIVERISDLKKFDVIRFAQKACSNLAIVDLVRRHGPLVDTVSAGEIHRALAAGYRPEGDPPPIVYTADLFDHEALELVVNKNIHVNCGSPDMISQLAEHAPGRSITLRINPGFGHGHSQKTNTGGEQSKHGIWHEQLDECAELATKHKLTISGLHMHIGSGTDIEHLSQVCSAMKNAVLQMGDSITSISAGGGLPVPYKNGEEYGDIDAYFQLWDETRNRIAEKFGHPISLEIEPGRYLTAESGYLLCEIRAIKQMGSNTYYLVDAGFNNLARPIMYGAYHPMAIVTGEGQMNRPLKEVIVGGPLCESGDIFTQEEGGFVCSRSLPEANIGDLLVIGNAGAYGAVMSSNYNSKPFATEVLIVDERLELIRSRQTFTDLIAGERIPK